MKRIFNIFASVSLITAGSSSVVACGGVTNNDQQIVTDITSHLKNKTFNVDENPNGTNNFGKYYESEILDQSGLNKKQKSLVTFPSSDNTKKLNAEEPTDIHVDVHSHNVSDHFNVSVKLNNNAQLIADQLDNQTITVYKPIHGPKDKFNSFTLLPISAYQSQIETQIHQLLSSKGIKNNYGINFDWTDPKTQLVDNLSWVSNAIIGLTINVGTKDTSKPINIRVKLAFSLIYAQQKREIDDPNSGSYIYPEQVNTGGATVKTSEWKDYQMEEQLNSAWDFGAFSQYVSYMPLSTITPHTPAVAGLLCPLLGITQNHFRMFWIEDNSDKG